MKYPMKKEVLIAILIGFGLGLTITYGIYRLRTALEDQPQTIADIVNSTNTPVPEAQSMIALLTPEDGAIQTETSTTIAGSTVANSMVVLIVNDADYIQQSDESGNFSFPVELKAGSNVITAYVLNENGEVMTKEKTVVVSDIYTSSDPLQATESAQQSEESENET
ncbi:MAG: hypothetical protein QG639_540 [Patescibacteria group bacterium]|jgi:hypothetical protein|nr:hypothetical protein [Patescibacteria group bacterium]